MELKIYQQDVINDIEKFNGFLTGTNNLKEAFRSFWASKGISLKEEDDYLHEYDNTIKGVPRVTVKVPTAGGKTFIACNALRTIFDSFHDGAPQVVAWFLPSDIILKQTYEKLNDPAHPYRQKIDTLFNGKVRVYDKPSLLMGQNFSPVDVKEQLSILVLSIQSFATNSKDGRLSYRENENLTEFVPTYTKDTPKVDGSEETGLIQVIAHLNPVVVIDESHNFTADLRVETLQSVNPKYILELTATPKRNSNIISFIDAIRLKKENMVKLPVIVYNQNSINDVNNGAINLQRSLEVKAKEVEANGGDFIRPIVLFQAQPKINEGTETFDKIKTKLVEIGIPEDQIKIKTAEKDELKNTNLMGRDCEVRYIITVDALKEGWDCPFAYILASLANKTSRISVEQILGRVLRQPYTRKHSCEFLNLSYVFTCSADFQRTLTGIVESLNKSGFSSKDFFAKDNTVQEEIIPKSVPQTPDLFSTSVVNTFSDDEQATPVSCEDLGTEDFDSVEPDSVKDECNTEYGNQKTEEVLKTALKEASKYNEAVENSDSDNDDTPADIMKNVSKFEMKEIFTADAEQIVLPQFFIQAVKTDFFNFATTDISLESVHLLKDFNLETCDKNIVFEQTSTEAVKIDLEERKKDEYVPKFTNLNDSQLKIFSEYIKGLEVEDKINQLARRISDMLKSKYNSISEPSIRRYIVSVLKLVDTYKLQNLANNILNTAAAFDNKIKSLSEAYKVKQFKRLLDIGKISVKDNYRLPSSITIKDKIIGIPRSLYLEEEKVDGFEYRVISQIANLDNVKYWHRNLERGKGFYINGFINHYPDFIIKMKSGKILLIEVKGDHLDGSDSERKIMLGTTWANKAGDKYRYFMVFDKKRVDNAYDLSSFIDLLKQF